MYLYASMWNKKTAGLQMNQKVEDKMTINNFNKKKKTSKLKLM